MRNNLNTEELATSADVLAAHLKSANLAKNLVNLTETFKPPRHPFSRDVVSLLALTQDLTRVNALPVSVVRDNLLAEIESYLNGTTLLTEQILQSRDENANLNAEIQGLKCQLSEKLSEIEHLQTSLNLLRESFEEMKSTLIYKVTEYRDLNDELLGKVERLETAINATPKSVFKKYCSHLKIKL